MTTADPTELHQGRSPAELAIEASGFAVQSRELPRLIRLVARRLPPGSALSGEHHASRETVRAALCEVRRKGWASRLIDRSQRGSRLWVTRADAQLAAELIDDPDADDAALAAALEPILATRYRATADSPEAALELVAAELFDGAGRVLSPQQHAMLAREIAEAFGGDQAFAEAATRTEQQRRAEREAVEAAARRRRRTELQRLRDWERSLVGFADVPALLGIDRGTALRLVAENRLPVARRVTRDGVEHWEFDPAELARLREQLVSETGAAHQAGAHQAGARQAGERQGRTQQTGIRIGNAAIARIAALDRYAAHFRTARALARRITLVTGPTNSGKSHTALDTLSRAESGMALAPLRLLAHEFREALGARGVPCSLSTGEERIPVPGSRHLAATVEMCPLHNPVDVAIVDEAQMLHDPDRGAAWTAAIMGAPARQLFVLGAPDCIPMVRRIAALCDDPLDEITLERKGPLVAADEAVKLAHLQRGDALIAFSRRDVLDLRAALLARGRRVAVVYGALSPEVRRAEAARFNAGDAEILVATDAIGMGLNLNIRRIVFAALRKFDGSMSRDLSAQEVKQIGGRAGRYGRHETGVVAVLAGAGSASFVRAMLAAPPLPQAELRPLVQPDADIVRAVAAEIGSDSLFGVLVRIRRAVLRRDDPNYRLADMGQAFAVASALEGISGLELTQRWTYAMCPIDERDNGITRLAAWAADHAAGRPVIPPGIGKLSSPERASRDELEHAEKRHKRLVAWRWLALRFPDAYPARQDAETATLRLNAWIEDVLRQQRRGKDT
ncbi:helicase-related protein [Lichenicoccus sp.]|uniref:helicase-related protein n=1 Tax=Lichenicoccus sp. TaxID=2781899 RepID=UPI003D0C6CAC